jgi:hypothetical protein
MVVGWLQVSHRYTTRTQKILDFSRAHPALSLAEVGRRFGVTREWVRKVLRREGINQRARSTLRQWLLCDYCRRHFVAPRSQVLRGRRFCSRTCAYAFRRVTHRAVRQCVVCQKTFLVPQYYLKIGKGKLCSRKCRITYVRQLRRARRK